MWYITILQGFLVGPPVHLSFGGNAQQRPRSSGTAAATFSLAVMQARSTSFNSSDTVFFSTLSTSPPCLPYGLPSINNNDYFFISIFLSFSVSFRMIDILVVYNITH